MHHTSTLVLHQCMHIKLSFVSRHDTIACGHWPYKVAKALFRVSILVDTGDAYGPLLCFASVYVWTKGYAYLASALFCNGTRVDTGLVGLYTRASAMFRVRSDQDMWKLAMHMTHFKVLTSYHKN